MDQINLRHRQAGEQADPNPIDDSMKPPDELADLAGSLQRARAGRPRRPGRQIGGLPSIGAWRLVNGLVSALRRAVGAVSRWRRRRGAIRMLQALSDHHLRDIGLDRSQIMSRVEVTTETGDPPV